MVSIYVDADSCPVKEEAVKVALRHGLDIYIVSNSWLHLAPNTKIHRVMVEAGADAADDRIVQDIRGNDIVITADILLAKRCIVKEAAVIAPNGKQFTEDNIGAAIAMRDLSAHLRETGEISGHNPGFTRQDKSRFLQTLDEVIQKMGRR